MNSFSVTKITRSQSGLTPCKPGSNETSFGFRHLLSWKNLANMARRWNGKRQLDGSSLKRLLRTVTAGASHMWLHLPFTVC